MSLIATVAFFPHNVLKQCNLTCLWPLFSGFLVQTKCYWYIHNVN